MPNWNAGPNLMSLSLKRFNVIKMNFGFGPLQPSPLKISFVLETCSLKETFSILETLGEVMSWCGSGRYSLSCEMWETCTCSSFVGDRIYKLQDFGPPGFHKTRYILGSVAYQSHNSMNYWNATWSQPLFAELAKIGVQTFGLRKRLWVWINKFS